ncbi:MAG TPA: hypothetical protein VFY23_06505, partial [Candidatus Limnocylindrales bacterium]|nr:hypothetical protein [Candidatus Limnocylindrales bacterium]
MPGFEPLVQRVLEELCVLQPDFASRVGDHRSDDRWPDVGPAGRDARRAFIDRWEERLRGLEEA